MNDAQKNFMTAFNLAEEKIENHLTRLEEMVATLRTAYVSQSRPWIASSLKDLSTEVVSTASSIAKHDTMIDLAHDIL